MLTDYSVFGIHTLRLRMLSSNMWFSRCNNTKSSMRGVGEPPKVATRVRRLVRAPRSRFGLEPPTCRLLAQRGRQGAGLAGGPAFQGKSKFEFHGQTLGAVAVRRHGAGLLLELPGPIRIPTCA